MSKNKTVKRHLDVLAHECLVTLTTRLEREPDIIVNPITYDNAIITGIMTPHVEATAIPLKYLQQKDLNYYTFFKFYLNAAIKRLGNKIIDNLCAPHYQRITFCQTTTPPKTLTSYQELRGVSLRLSYNDPRDWRRGATFRIEVAFFDMMED